MTVFAFILAFEPSLPASGIKKIRVNGRAMSNATAKVVAANPMDKIEYIGTTPGFPACMVSTRVY